MRSCHAPNNSHNFLSLWPSTLDHFVPLYRQHWVAPEQQLSPAFLQLNPQQLRRRSLYSSTLPARPAVLPGIRKALVAPAEQQAWVQRELQALTLQDDVKIVKQVVLRSVEALAQIFSSQGTRYCHRCLLPSSVIITHACFGDIHVPPMTNTESTQCTYFCKYGLPDDSDNLASTGCCR